MSVTGISFDGKHSYDEWGLKLKKIEIGLPEVKTEYIEVPGMNGDLDLSEAQNGGVKYGMRDLKFTFGKLGCTYNEWCSLIAKVSSELHGKTKKIILETDKSYYYTGRCQVSASKTNDVFAEIVVQCKCDPFKMSVSASNEAWLWDTFSFEHGTTENTEDIIIKSPNTWQKVAVDGYVYNDTLAIVSNAEMQMKYKNVILDVEVGENTMYDFVLDEGQNDLYFKGSGRITLIHRGGML